MSQLKLTHDGRPDAPLLIRACPGEKVIIDGTDPELTDLATWHSDGAGTFSTACHGGYRSATIFRNTDNKAIRLFPVRELQHLKNRAIPEVGTFRELGIEGAVFCDGDRIHISFHEPLDGHVILGTLDYGVVDGIGGTFASLVGPGTPSGDTGLILFNAARRFRDATDGTTNTAIIWEDAGRPNRWELGKQVSGQCSSGAAWADMQSEYYIHGSNLDGSGGRCAINCTNDNEVYNFHVGGAHTLIRDGSVQFISQNADFGVIAAYVSCGGGEVPGQIF